MERDEYRYAQLAQDVLEHEGKALTAVQIWEAAKRLGLDKRRKTIGNTPWDSIRVELTRSIEKHPKSSPFLRFSHDPILFYLKDLPHIDDETAEEQQEAREEEQASLEASEKWKEEDLHPLLATYLQSAEHFQCFAKTIDEKRSHSGSKNANLWTHPDMVGVYLPYGDYEASTIDLAKSLGDNPYLIFSFELKKSVTRGTLRQNYFQAVSNSSWANEGYLVAEKVDKEPDFRDDLQRLVNAFGIGVIELDVRHIEESQILYPARHRETLDWATVDRLVRLNPDYRQFVVDVVSSVRMGELMNESHFDKPIAPEEYDRYLAQRGFAKFE